jgi:hypothetical protein
LTWIKATEQGSRRARKMRGGVDVLKEEERRWRQEGRPKGLLAGFWPGG